MKCRTLDAWLGEGYGSLLYSFSPQEVCVTLRSDSIANPQTTCTSINQTCDSSCALQASKERAFDSFYAFLVGETPYRLFSSGAE